jgi:hypothetical protein
MKAVLCPGSGLPVKLVPIHWIANFHSPYADDAAERQ